MINIEVLAKELFERFAYEETGREAKWQYLGVDRQRAWVKDAILIADKIFLELKKDVKPIPPGQHPKMATSYSLGYFNGVLTERTQLITTIDLYHKEMMEDYKNFIEEE